MRHFIPTAGCGDTTRRSGCFWHKDRHHLAQAAPLRATGIPRRSKLSRSATNRKASIMSTAQGSAPQGCRPQSTSTSEGPLGTFEILNVPSRVMTPPRSLPLDKFRLEAPELLIDEVFGNEFVEKASEVASRLNLGKSITWVEITSRVSRYNSLESLPTLLIVMDNWEETSPGPWQDLVQGMKKYIGM